MAEPQTHADQARLINEVHALTLEIDTAVKLSDWQRAARLAGERSPMVRAISPVQSAAALALIRDIQTLDAARLAMLRAAHVQLSAEYRQAKASVGAARQYQKMARLF